MSESGRWAKRGHRNHGRKPGPATVLRVPVQRQERSFAADQAAHRKALPERHMAVLGRLTSTPQRPSEVAGGLSPSQIGDVLRKLSQRGLALRTSTGWIRSES